MISSSLKKLCHRGISMLLALVMVLGMLPVAAYAADSITVTEVVDWKTNTDFATYFSDATYTCIDNENSDVSDDDLGAVTCSGNSFILTAKADEYCPTTTLTITVDAAPVVITYTKDDSVSTSFESGSTIPVNGTIQFSVTSDASSDKTGTVTISVAPSTAEIPEDAATYYVNGVTFNYLDKAIDAAVDSSKTIIVTASGTVYHSLGEKKFTIPGGVKLLVPFYDKDTGNFSEEPATSTAAPGSLRSPYVTLTLGANTIIECEGQICVNGPVYNGGTSTDTSQPTGSYGQIKLSAATSKIILKDVNEDGTNTGKLYCYGYITGDGGVVANSGAMVYEVLQLLGWRGEYHTSNWAKGAGVYGNEENTINSYAFNDYAIQNIEADVTFHHGAMGKAVAVVQAMNTTKSIDVDYVGTTTGFVRLTESGASLHRSYDSATNHITYTMGGKVQLGNLDIFMQFTGLEGLYMEQILGTDNFDLDTAEHIFAINSYMDLVATGDSTVTLLYDYKLMPGASITVNQGGTVIVNGRLFVYDTDDYVDKGYMRNSKDSIPVQYVATTQKIGGNPIIDSNTPNGQLVVNGTLKVCDPVGTEEADKKAAIYVTNQDGNPAENMIKGTGKFINESVAKNEANLLDEIKFTGSGTSSQAQGYDIPVVPLVSQLAGVSVGEENSSFVNDTYHGLGNGWWYQHTVSFTGDLDELKPINNSQIVVNGDTAIGYSCTGGVLEFTLPYVYAVTASNNKVTAAAYENGAAMVYSLEVDVENVTIAVEEGENTENTVTITMISRSSREIVGSVDCYIPVGTDVSAYYNSVECTTKAGILAKGDALFQLVEAKIGEDQYYTTLKAAIENADADDEVVLLADITLNEAITVPAGKTLNLNLNGKTVTYTAMAFAVNGTLNLDMGSGGKVTNSSSGQNSTISVRAGAKLSIGGTGMIENKATAGGLSTINNKGEITSISGNVSIKNASYYGIRNEDNAKIVSIGSEGSEVTISADQYGIYMIGNAKITTIGGSGSDITIKGTNYGVYMDGDTEITTIGAGNDTVTIESNKTSNVYTGLWMEENSSAYIGTIGGGNKSTVNIKGYRRAAVINASAEIGTIGTSGSTVNFTATGPSTDKSAAHGVYSYGTIGTIGGQGSKVNITGVRAYSNTNTDTQTNAYGLYLAGDVTTIGAAGSEITITGKSDANANMRGIFVTNGGSVTNIGGTGAAIKITDSAYTTVNGGFGIAAPNGTIGSIGNGANITIQAYTGISCGSTTEENVGTINTIGSDTGLIKITAAHAGISTANNSSGKSGIGTIGGKVEVVSAQYGIYNGATIGELANGVVLISNGDSSCYVVYNTEPTETVAAGKTNLISGGKFHHRAGREYIFSSGTENMTYPEGYSLSTTTESFILSDNSIKACYFVMTGSEHEHFFENGICSGCGAAKGPIIIKQPVDGKAEMGQIASVTVEAEGTGLTYEWWYKDANSETWKKTSSFTGDTYYVEMTAARAGRSLYCVITDANGLSVTTNTVMLINLAVFKEDNVEFQWEQWLQPLTVTAATYPKRTSSLTTTTYFPEGSTHSGILYSSTFREGTDALWNLNPSTYYSAVMNPASLLYTVDYSNRGSTQGGWSGSVCSTTALRACGYDFPYTTTEIAMAFQEKTDHSINNVEVGDILWVSGHVAGVVDVTRDENGNVTKVTIIEQAAYVKVFEKTAKEWDSYFSKTWTTIYRGDINEAIKAPQVYSNNVSMIFERGNNTYVSDYSEMLFYIPTATTVYMTKDGVTSQYSVSSFPTKVVNNTTVYDLASLFTGIGDYYFHTDEDATDMCIKVISNGNITISGTTATVSGYANCLPIGYRLIYISEATPESNYNWWYAPEGYTSNYVRLSWERINSDTFEIHNIPEDSDGWKIELFYDTDYGWARFLSDNIMFCNEHSWQNATCTAPKTCEVCGITDGEVADHTDSDSNNVCDECEYVISGTGGGKEENGTTVSGTAVSWNDSDDAVYLLYSSTTEDADIKDEWAKNEPEYIALYTAAKGSITDATMEGKDMKSQTFTFEGVEEGTYKLVILKSGKYVPKIVEVTVGNVPIDVGQQKLWLYGDVNYDGLVLSDDAVQINRYFNNKSSVFNTGDVQTKADRLKAADVNYDGLVLSDDAVQINRYFNNKSSVFALLK